MLTTDTTGASNESADTTTTAVSGATDEVSGTGYYGGFSFELSESEVVVEEGVDAELSISVDVKNLRGSWVLRCSARRCRSRTMQARA